MRWAAGSSQGKTARLEREELGRETLGKASRKILWAQRWLSPGVWTGKELV